MPNFKLFLAALVLVGLLSSTFNAYAAPLKPVSISYSIGLDGSKVGNGIVGKIKTKLSITDTGYAIESVTQFQGLAVFFAGSNHQESCEFEVKNGKAFTSSYSGGRIDKKDYTVGFDWKANKIDFNKNESVDMPQGYVVDNCVMWFATALQQSEGFDDQVMYVVDGNKKRIRGYKKRSSDTVTIETKLGTKEVIKLVLERELRPERTLTFWLSPENQYLPLKIQESRKSRTTTFEVETLELLNS